MTLEILIFVSLGLAVVLTLLREYLLKRRRHKEMTERLNSVLQVCDECDFRDLTVCDRRCPRA